MPLSEMNFGVELCETKPDAFRRAPNTHCITPSHWHASRSTCSSMPICTPGAFAYTPQTYACEISGHNSEHCYVSAAGAMPVLLKALEHTIVMTAVAFGVLSRLMASNTVKAAVMASMQELTICPICCVHMTNMH